MNRLRIIHFVLTVLLLAAPAGQAAAQERLTYIVEGTVTDASSGKAMEGVDVGAPEQGYFTVTNRDGAFTLKSDQPLSRLTFSFPGYETRTLSPGEPEGKELRIRLVPVSNLLREAIVVSGNPREIVQEAIDRIPLNYPRRGDLADCFYRETVQKRQRFISVSEAVMLLHKTTYDHGIWQDGVAVKEGRQLMSPRQADTLSVKVTGGPSQGAYLDPVKNRELLFDDLDLYRLDMLPGEIIDGRPHFVVGLEPNAYDCPYALYHGRLYIDQNTLAFTRIELSLDMADKNKATRMMLVKKPARLRFLPKELALTVSYAPDPDDGLMRLRYVRTRFQFNCDWKKRLFATSFTAVNEMVVTHRHTEGPTGFARKETFPRHASLSDRIGEFDDPDFWKDYNIIEPSESLEHAIGRLKKQK